MRVAGKDTNAWTTVIQPRTGWFDIQLQELWAYRDLILLFVRRDFVAYYKQTVLGPLWFVLQPLFSTLVFTVVFGNIAKIPTDGIPHVLFYMSGIVMWNYFADCLNKTSNTFVNNAAIFGKVYFPRLAVPVSIVITNLLTFAIQFCLLMGFVAYFSMRGAPIHVGTLVLIIPALLVQMAALGLGVGILVSSLTTRYRDLHFVMGFGVQLWMYATPIVYPLSQVPARWQWISVLNPMTAVVETFRCALLGSGTFSFPQYALSAAMTGVILVAGIFLFGRVEKTFMDTV